MEKTALFVLNDKLLVEILKLIFKEIDYDIKTVRTPKEAIDSVEAATFPIVVLGKNDGTVVKSRLADIIYEKSLKPKPHIIIIKEPGDMIYKADYISTIRYPSFHQEMLKSISNIDESKKIEQVLYGDKHIGEDFIKSSSYSRTDIALFFKNMKGNQKFGIKEKDKKMVGFVMSGELYILYSDFQDPYGVFLFNEPEVVKEELKIQEFLSLQIGSDVFKINFREFIYRALERVYDRDKLISFLPSPSGVIDVKAPHYILEQCHFVKENFDTRWLESKSKDVTVDEILKEYKYDLGKLRALVAMYILGMVDILKDEVNVETKFDVKIKKSFLKKIIDKIRGL